MSAEDVIEIIAQFEVSQPNTYTGYEFAQVSRSVQVKPGNEGNPILITRD